MATAISEVSSLTGRRTSMPVPPANLSPPQFAPLDDLASAAVRGLSGHPKQIPARWLYDRDGSALFEKIAKVPEYYITGAEQSVLAAARASIAVTGARTLIELGSGAPERTRLLVDALRATLTAYMPFGVSSSAMSRTSAALAAECPAVAVTPLVADFTESLDHPPADGPRLMAILGGTFGNLLPHERARFLNSIAVRLGPGDRLLLSVGLGEHPSVILRAYDDAAGLSAQFNTSLLRRLNRELGADFDLDAFEHVAVWDEAHQWVDMRLRSRQVQTVTLRRIGLMVPFAAGEDLRIKVSATFQPHILKRELMASGLELKHWWSDQNDLFGLALARRADDITSAA